MSQPATTFFTAAQLARALGKSRQAVRHQLAGSPANGELTVSGQAAKAWSFAALPAAMQADLETAAQLAGFRDALHLLSSDGRKSAPARKTAPRRQIISLAAEMEFQQLRDAIAAYEKSNMPAIEKRPLLWEDVFRAYEQKLSEGKAPKKLKRRLVEFLARNAALLVHNESVSPAHALSVNFQRKYNAWVKAGRALPAIDDRRREQSGHWRAPDLTDEDRKLLTAAGAKFGGGLNQAWRICFPQLTAEIRNYYSNNFSAPRVIYNLLATDVKLEKINLRGPRAVRTAGAYVNRDPDSIASGDWDSSDDMTMINVWWEELPNGELWCGQGQLLVWIDERSWFAFSYNLISSPSYNSFSIRNSWTVKADAWGLPRRGLALERGIWQTSKLLVGERPPLGHVAASPLDETAIDAVETQAGLRRLGMEFHNYTHARGKVIERIYGTLQDYFQSQPGYIGRNPFTDKYEKVQEQIRLVKSGKAHPSEFFLSKSEWDQILKNVLLDYNRTPKHGKYHRGLSPAQAYEKFYTDKLVKVPLEHRYLLAAHKIERNVTGNGIAFKVGKETFRYKGYDLGGYQHRTVIAFFNPENPETIYCTDKNSQNPFIAEREQIAPLHDASDGRLNRAQLQNTDQNRYQKELHRSLKPYYNSPFFKNLFRPTIVDAQTVERSKEFARQRTEYDARATEAKRLESRARNAAGKIGAALPPGRIVNASQVKSLEKLQKFLDESRESAQRKEQS